MVKGLFVTLALLVAGGFFLSPVVALWYHVVTSLKF